MVYLNTVIWDSDFYIILAQNSLSFTRVLSLQMSFCIDLARVEDCDTRNSMNWIQFIKTHQESNCR